MKLIFFDPLISHKNIIAVLMAIVLLASCSGRRGEILQSHKLFSMDIGTLPGELDWFYRESFQIAATAEIDTRNGLVYISGGNVGKVLVFNSYGDLVTYLYDPKRNPVPLSVTEDDTDGSFASWSFNNPRLIAAFDGGFLVEDGVENERKVKYPETGGFHDRVILRFNEEGEYLGYLGREGFGGSPFPFISSLDIREDERIVVTSSLPGMWISYWHEGNGRPLSKVEIHEDKLPFIDDSSSVTVYSVRPDPINWKLYIRLDVYDSDNFRPEPRLYTLDLSTLNYSEPIIMPYIGGDEESGIPSVPPNYLGTVLGGNHVLIAPTVFGRYNLVVMDDEGRFIHNRLLTIDAPDLIYQKFRLQNDGILTGLFFSSLQASVIRWRIDQIIAQAD